MASSSVRHCRLVLVAVTVMVAGAAVIAGSPGAAAQVVAAQVPSSHQAALRGGPLGGRPLSEALTSSGTLTNAQGSFDARGFRMVVGRNGAPRFVRAGVAASPGSTSAANAPWSDHFGNVGAGDATQILAVAVSGADVYIGGTFSDLSYDPHLAANNVAMWNGHGWYSLGSGSHNGVNATVRAIAVAGGAVYVGGDFNNAGGTPANYIAKWNGTVWSALGAGMSGSIGSFTGPTVDALAVSGSTLYAAGLFDDAGSVVAHSVASWNGSSWSALGGGILSCNYFDVPNHCYSTPDSGQVNALLVSGSNLYAGGSFDLVGSSETYSLAVWSSGAWSAVGGSNVQDNSSDGTVNALAMGGTNLYIAGTFDQVDGVSAASVASFDGSTWRALGSGANNCTGCGAATVTSLAYWNSRLYMTGAFYSAGGDNTPEIAQWNGSAWSPVGPSLDGSVSQPPNAMAVSSAGVVTVGLFPSAGGGKVTLNNVGLWTGSRWAGYGLGLSYGTNAGWVGELAASGHNLYAGGSFYTAGSTPIPGNLAHFNGTSWDTMGGGVSGGIGDPFAIAIVGHDVYVGGSFSQAGKVAASNIAMWDGSKWHALGSGVDGRVNALLVYKGKLWVGGGFGHAGGRTARELATWNLTTHTWAHVGGDPIFEFGAVDALAGVPSPNNHYVVIGGNFTWVASGKTRAKVNGIVYFNTAAKITSPYSGYYLLPGRSGSVGVRLNGCSGCSGRVDALLVDGTKIYVGGSFDDAGSVASHGFARYSLAAKAPNGWSSPGVVGGGTSGGTVSAIVKVGTSYYLAGDFSSAGHAAAHEVARYTPASGAWAGLGSGLGAGIVSDSSAMALAQSTDGLYVGGTFALAGGKASENLALWTATAGIP